MAVREGSIPEPSPWLVDGGLLPMSAHHFPLMPTSRT